MRYALLCLVLFFLPFTGFGQDTLKPHYKYYNCKFSIKVSDTLTINNKKHLRINAVILNDSQDTLTYGMEDYDFFYFHVISNNFSHVTNEGLRNVFIPVEVLPHKSTTHSILLQAKNNQLTGSIQVKFKLLLTRAHYIGPDMVLTKGGNIVTLSAADVESRTHYINSNTMSF